MLATADDRGYFIRLNPAWTTTLGYELDELTTKPFIEFVHPEDREATSAEAARQIELGQTVLNFQNRYRHRDGSYRWLEWASTPSADGSRLYAMARDITARKAEEDRLAALAAPAREREARRVAAHAVIEGVIATRAFAPVYQPIVDLASRDIVGFEALTRFDGGRRPDEMFAEALDCGLGTALEAATLETALAQAAELPRRAWLSLNVSPAMIELDGVLEGLLQRTGRSVVLEITEHEAVTEYGSLRDAVLRLGPRIRLAVDDTGAGVANFNHLVELRADFIKIDVGLVRGVEHDVGRQAVVAGLVHFAASAGCQVIAEGIETEAEQATVTGLGVTLGQGYLLARPAPVAMWRDSSIARLASVLPLRPTPGKDGRRTSLVS
jgi:PAS domain S-box-containing protein